jgi:soluble lytic murein transglycosylase-like protein
VRRPTLRSLRGIVAAVIVAAVAVGAFLLLRGGDEASYSPVNLDDDPWAYDPDRQAEFESRAAAGHSHVVYEKSPGGIVATAARVARYRDDVEKAADESGVDPDLIEGMVLLESAGLPDARASDDLESAAGLTQILAQTATGLLGMQVDVAASERLTRKLIRARGPRQAERLRAQRARVDERFDPAKALAATGRYLKQARDEFGREDLAVVSYHMGIGNLQNVVARYGDDGASYAQLYFDASPDSHPEAYRLLYGLGDDSKTYYWRVLASAEVMRLYRDDREKLDRLAELQARSDSAEYVLHPDGPADGAETGTLRPEASAVLAYIRNGVRKVSGVRAPLTVVHRRGFAFDIRRRYASDAQAQAFQYMLDRLQALDVIAWARRGNIIHTTASEEGRKLRQ